MKSASARTLLLLATLIVIGAGQPALAAEVSRHSNGCEAIATTGRSVAGRDPEGGKTCARVDNRLPSHVLRPPAKKGERPIDRLRSRGEGRPQAIGDKGARRQLNEAQRTRR